MRWAAIPCNDNIPILRDIIDLDTGALIAHEMLYCHADTLVEEHNSYIDEDDDVLINPLPCFSVAPPQ